MKRILPLVLVLATASVVAAKKPSITSPTTATAQVGVAFSYQITADQTITTWGASGLPAGLAVNTSTGLISGTPTGSGTFSVGLSATNGNGTGNATLTLTIKPAPPVITSALTATGQTGVAFSYTITATNGPTSFNASPLPAGLIVNTSTGVISGTPTTVGTYSVTISATNSGGTGSATLTITIKLGPPVITSATTATGQVGVAFSYQIAATNNPTSFNAAGLPSGLTVNTGTGLISGTPAAGTNAGSPYSVTISATNAAGTGSATLTLTIKPPPPVITSASTAAGIVGTAFSYQITATNNPTSFNATGLPAGLTVSTTTGAISGTPTTAGIYQVTISATNSGGTGSATLVITIGPFSATGTEGQPFSYQIPATGTPASYNATGLPSGLSVNTSTGLISGTPAAGTNAGSPYSVTISATYGTGAGAITGSGTLTLTINPPPPVITSANTASGTVGIAFSYQITATNNPTSYNATGLPAGLTVNTSTGLISGTPTTVDIYQVTISATNAGGTGSATLVITIGAFNAVGTQNVPFSYQIPATGTPASYSATGLPGGLTVNTTTGVISGTPTTVGTFSVAISATYGTGASAITSINGTFILAITGPAGPAPTFPGQQTDIPTNSSSPPPSNSVITFLPNANGNSFKLYWNSGTNPQVADQSSGGLTRYPSTNTTNNSSPVAMQVQSLNTSATPTPTPIPSLNVWRGNPSPPNGNTPGQFGDPRASWYITDPWPAANYLTSSYWGGPTPQFLPLTWPDSGHNAIPLPNGSPAPGLTPSGLGQYPNAVAAVAAKTSPTPDPNRWISKLGAPPANCSTCLNSTAELGNVLDPAQLSYTVTNPGGALPDITSATPNSKSGGGYTLAIGRPEFSVFNQNGMRAWQLLDVFSAANPNTQPPLPPGTTGTTGLSSGQVPVTNTAGLVNVNTASLDVLRALAAGILQSADAAIQPCSLLPLASSEPCLQQKNGLYPPTSQANKQAGLFANAVINSRPLLSTAALSAIRDSTGQPFFGNPNQYNNSTQTQPTEWNDAGREELFSKILNLTTTRSRNFRVFITGQSLDKNGNVLSTVTKVYHVFIEPIRGPTTGAIISQQVVIKYEGSM